MRYLSAHYVYPVSSPPLRNGILCVDDNGCIIDVIDVGGKLEERERLEFYNGILAPGFVNAHCHLELSHLRGIIEPRGGLPGFVSSIGHLRRASCEIILDAAKAADEEMTGNGIVAVGDISNHADTLHIKRNSNIQYRTFIELFGLDDHRSQEIFTAAQQVKQEYDHAGMAASLAPHAVYSMSQTLCEALYRSYQSSPPDVVSMHHQESSEEQFIIHQKSIINDCLRKASRCLLVHNLFSSYNDLTEYTSPPARFYFVLCPKSNLYIQNRLPDFQLFSSQKLCPTVCLGTDSLASNTGLSILEEMKTVQRYAPEISFDTLLQWATLNGAHALGFDRLLGSFEKNKRPGVNLITGIDFEKKKLTDDSEVKVLVAN